MRTIRTRPRSITSRGAYYLGYHASLEEDVQNIYGTGDRLHKAWKRGREERQSLQSRREKLYEELLLEGQKARDRCAGQALECASRCASEHQPVIKKKKGKK